VDTEQTLLEALHADACDTVTWSALADCLEEKGEGQRAELLRLSRLPPAGKKARATAEECVRKLLAAGVAPCVPILENSIGMRFALIPPGKFLMGSPKKEKERSEDEGPQHEVQITRPFYLGIYPVTQAQYNKVMRHRPSYFCPGGGGKESVRGLDTSNFPVECVSWEDAVTYCHRLSEMAEEKRSKRLYTLPSEAQWEYACRAGTSTPFHFGKTLAKGRANFRSTLGRPGKVGSHPPNKFGLFDMHGNVREWCQDWFDENYYARSPDADPPGPPTGEGRVIRGGSWYFDGRECRSAYRNRYDPSYRDDDVGFRVALLPA
jgi:uncharacterized protein (TIGR02996 family)